MPQRRATPLAAPAPRPPPAPRAQRAPRAPRPMRPASLPPPRFGQLVPIGQQTANHRSHLLPHPLIDPKIPAPVARTPRTPRPPWSVSRPKPPLCGRGSRRQSRSMWKSFRRWRTGASCTRRATHAARAHRRAEQWRRPAALAPGSGKAAKRRIEVGEMSRVQWFRFCNELTFRLSGHLTPPQHRPRGCATAED